MSDVSSPNFWETIYQNRTTGWDLGGPTPVFCRLAESGEFPPGSMIVPGAGRGWDARMFARHGFTVTAVDFAADAVRDMHTLADPAAPVVIIKADIFSLPPIFENRFDYVLEYTCFCAIHPDRRGDYADVIHWLLKPGGTFIGLIFPLGDHEGGPPFAMSSDQVIRLLTERGLRLIRREIPPDSVERRKGIEELVILRKE